MSEKKQKICVECRAMVPEGAEECPECGYPFDNAGVTRCASCNSIIVDDVQNCPVCNQEINPLPATEVAFVAPPPVEEVVPFQPSVPLETNQPLQQEEQVNGADYSAVISRLDTITYALHELANAIQSNSKINDDVIRMIRESSTDVRNSISENQATNQRVLKEATDIIKVAYESVGAGSKSASSEQIVEVKAAIADIAAQQNASAGLVIAAVKEGSAKTAAVPPIELPSSLKWLDYMFIAIIVMLIFSMGNLLVMAYIARLVMALE